jgi:Spy/CpxP family protein refolding chaperone
MGLRAGFPGEAPWGPPPGIEHGMDAPMPPYLQGLSLSDEQQDRIFDLLHGQAPEVRQLARSLQKTHSQLRDLGFADNYDEAAARALAVAHAKAESELALLRARTDHQILALLTAAQRQQVAAATPGSGRERPGAGHGGGCWH